MSVFCHERTTTVKSKNFLTISPEVFGAAISLQRRTFSFTFRNMKNNCTRRKTGKCNLFVRGAESVVGLVDGLGWWMGWVGGWVGLVDGLVFATTKLTCGDLGLVPDESDGAPVHAPEADDDVARVLRHDLVHLALVHHLWETRVRRQPASRRVASRHVTSRRVVLRRVASHRRCVCDVNQRRVTSRHVASRHVTSSRAGNACATPTYDVQVTGCRHEINARYVSQATRVAQRTSDVNARRSG